MTVILAGTGHRKLSPFVARKMRYLCECEIKLHHKHEIDHGISGMALGFDMIWAEALLQLGIPLVAAVPFEGQEKKWPSAEQERYHGILKKASEVVFVNGRSGYANWKFHTRNKWMVDHCTKMVACWDGSSKGGTASCMEYVKKVKRPYTNLWEML